jgi:hypothetical protein
VQGRLVDIGCGVGAAAEGTNVRKGFLRAVQTFRPDAVDEVFEVAEPGKPVEVYSRTRFTRVKELPAATVSLALEKTCVHLHPRVRSPV